MRIIGTCCFWNSEDIIEALIRHSLTFCTGMVLLDHGSPDASPEIIRQLQREGLPVHMVSDPTLGNMEVEHINRLLKLAAHEHAADWIISLDDDEFLDGGIEAGFLPPHEEGVSTCRKIRLHTYYTQPGDGDEILNPVERITHRLAREPDIGECNFKVIVPGWLARKEGGMLGQGKHKFYMNSAEPPFEVVESVWLGHFSLRSPGHYASKIAARQLQKLRYIPDLGDSIPFYDKPYEALCASYTQTVDAFRKERVSYQMDTGQVPLVHDPLKYRGGPLRYTKCYNDTDKLIRNLLHLGVRLALTPPSQDVAGAIPSSLSIEATTCPVPGKAVVQAIATSRTSLHTLILPLDWTPGSTDVLLKMRSTPGMIEIEQAELLAPGTGFSRVFKKEDLTKTLHCLAGGMVVSSPEFYRLFVSTFGILLKLQCKEIPATIAPTELVLKFRYDNQVSLPVLLNGPFLDVVSKNQRQHESLLQNSNFAPTHIPFHIDFTERGNGELFISREGWCDPEAWGRWTEGSTAALEIRFAQKPSRDLRIAITTRAICVAGQPPVEASVKINGETSGHVSFPVAKRKTLKFRISAANLASGKCKIVFEIKNAKSQRALALSEDSRRLGLGIEHIDCHWGGIGGLRRFPRKPRH